MTELRSWSLPTKERDLADQELIRLLTFSRGGAQSNMDRFLEDRGNPRYLIGRDPHLIPIAELI